MDVNRQNINNKLMVIAVNVVEILKAKGKMLLLAEIRKLRKPTVLRVLPVAVTGSPNLLLHFTIFH